MSWATKNTVKHSRSHRQPLVASSFELNLGHFTALLLAGNHPAHIDVVVGKGLPGLLNGGLRQRSSPAQDPGKVNMEEPQNIRAGIDQGVVDIVCRQDPVWGVREHCGAETAETD